MNVTSQHLQQQFLLNLLILHSKKESGDGNAAEMLIICLMIDNLYVNPKIAHEFNMTMIGVYCQCLNLAAKLWLEGVFGSDLKKDYGTIKAIMHCASTFKCHGSFEKFTAMCQKNNETYGNGTKI